MKKSKKLIFFSIAVFIIILSIIALLVINLKFTSDNAQDEIVIISISNKKDKAIVKRGTGSSVDEAYKNAKNMIDQYVASHNYDVQWTKVDIVKDKKQLSLHELESEISEVKDYSYRNGIMLDVENRKIILTEAELNSNSIIDYYYCDIDLNNLNTYLSKSNESTLSSLPNTITVFSTTSYFYDKDNCYELHNEGPNTGRRKQENLQKSELESILDTATNYLSNLVQEDGCFIYGFNPLTNKKNSDYNILRHAGSVWSLIANYDGTEIQKQKIEKSLAYLNKTICYDDNQAYVIEEKSDEIKLGGNALTIIAMCEYTTHFEDITYVETLKKLGNGILRMQEKDGSYIHTLNLDYSNKDKTRTVYYDGEATFALCKLYGLTKDEKYLTAAKKALTYFIANDYTQYSDHWISYAINEVTKYVNDKNFYELGLKNIAYNLDEISKKDYTSHTNFEMLLQGFELYNRIKENNIELNYMKTFPLEKFIKILKEKADFQLNSYLYPEIAMYLDNPSKYCGSFFIRNSSFQIRIDDIQHSLLGYYYYSKNFDKINTNL